jgi:hypothetical protein
MIITAGPDSVAEDLEIDTLSDQPRHVVFDVYAAELIPQLLRCGGFPEAFLKSSARFYNRWRRLRNELLFREDLRDPSQIREVGRGSGRAVRLQRRTAFEGRALVDGHRPRLVRIILLARQGKARG